jgi:hypothetical protein
LEEKHRQHDRHPSRLTSRLSSPAQSQTETLYLKKENAGLPDVLDSRIVSDCASQSSGTNGFGFCGAAVGMFSVLLNFITDVTVTETL